MDRVESSEIGCLLIAFRGKRRLALCGVKPSTALLVRGRRRGWDDVADQLRELARENRVVLGYTSFEAASLWERLPYRSPAPFNDLEYFGFDSPLIEQIETPQLGAVPPTIRGQAEILSERPGFEGYVKAVEGAKRHIELGEVFQIVLASRLCVRFQGDYTRVFLYLLAANPSPYMFYFKLGDRRIIGCSPETLVRVSGRRVETYPIAGTRPVTGNPERDRALRSELLASRKDHAEHVMLVDLARNDLGKVCLFGSVRVTQYRRVVGYSHVQHLVSKVVGVLKEGMDAFDAYAATFPAGTVSGAPKIRAIELIHEFEEEPRGPYAGGVGYFIGPDRMDHAINIRSLYAVGEVCVVQAGAGIVAASDPTSEYYETRSKAKVVLEALGVE